MFPEEIIVGYDEYDDTLTYPNKSFFPGFTVGILAEYSVPESRWSFGMKVGILDYFKNETKNFIGDTLKKEYINTSKFNYVSISPFAKYELSKTHKTIWDGFYGFTGLLFEIPVKAVALHTKAIYNPVRIEETAKYTYKEQLFRANLQTGIGLDIFDLNMEKGARTIFSPFIAFDIGSNVMKDFDSKLFTYNIKMGFSLKLIVDKKVFDTLRYVHKETPKINIQIVEESSIDNIREIIENTFEATNIEPIFVSTKQDRRAPSLEPAIPYSLGTNKDTNELEIDFDRKYVINFPNSGTDVEISSMAIAFLDKIASFLAENDGSIVAIAGYNDDQGGSTGENQRLSFIRAENAKQKLLDVGIDENRILTYGRGSIQNIAPNTTEEGRAQNRRIEIIVRRSKK
jgi:outer membrane protein OmpA-like peptidoglycan-associated protein